MKLRVNVSKFPATTLPSIDKFKKPCQITTYNISKEITITIKSRYDGGRLIHRYRTLAKAVSSGWSSVEGSTFDFDPKHKKTLTRILVEFKEVEDHA